MLQVLSGPFPKVMIRYYADKADNAWYWSERQKEEELPDNTAPPHNAAFKDN
jgi:hypothetical protein